MSHITEGMPENVCIQHSPNNRLADTTSNNSTSTPQTINNPLQRKYRHTRITDFSSDIQKLNIPLGDLPDTKDDHSIRIYFQNINGIKHDNDWIQWSEGIQQAKELQCNILCIAETNLYWTDSNFQRANSKVKQQFKHTKMSTSNCLEPTIGDYQPGGTATIITDKWTSRVTTNIADTSGLGRWSGFKFRAKQHQSVYIITAYCPHKDNKQGSNTTYQQQWRMLRQQTNTIPDPRHKFFQDLSTFIQQIHHDGDKVILAWDANTTLDSDTITSFMASNNIMSLMNDTPSEASTYTRGKRVIDHIMGSTTIPFPNKHGMFAFYDGAWPSDHRGLYIDVNSSVLFGNSTETISNPTKRYLSSNNVHSIRKFLQNIEKLNEYQAIYDNLLLLMHTPKPWTPADFELLEQQDVKFTKTLLQAEATLQPHYDTPWSPKLHHAAQVLLYWKLTMSQQRNNLSPSTRHQQLHRELGESKYVLPSLNKPYAQLRKSKQILKQIRIDAIQHRTTFLTVRQEEFILQDEMKKAKIFKTIGNAERRKRSFRTIKHKLQPHRSTGGISHVLHHDNHGNLHRIDDRHELETRLHERNRTHFRQAHGTPFTISPLVDTLGECGCTAEALNIIQGKEEAIPIDTHHAAIKLLQECKQQRIPMSPEFPTEAILDGFKKWRESTTTSPSGKHLGFYKAIRIAHLHKLRTDNETDTDSSIADKLLFIQSALINLAIQQCHTYKRWTIVHNFFLEKLPGTPLIDKLRVIHLYEADWNLILKYFIAHKLLKTATIQGTTCTEQAGGRPNRSAIDEATKTVLLYETCRLQRVSGGIMYNDAKACFDRIIENISNMSCIREGLPIEIAQLHNQTFKAIRYYIKYKGGIATQPNHHSNNDPFYGVGQGSGDAGTRWGFVSDCIIRAYNKHSSHAIITGPISKIFINEKCQLFVDDSRLFAIILQDENFHLIHQTLQQNTQVWEELLYASGGKLELQKCKYCVFSWKINDDGSVVLDNQYNHDPIQLISSETKLQMNVEAITTSTPYKLLGVQIAFDGNSIQQQQSFVDKCQTYAKLFSQLPLPPSEVYAGYIGAALPSLRYPLPSTTISVKAIIKGQQPFINALLPKLGFNRHFPRKVTFAPEQVGGLGIHNFAVEQGVAHTLVLLNHLRSQTPMTPNCIQLLESYQIFTGILEPPTMFTDPILHIDATLAPWLEVTRSFLHQINAHIRLPNLQQIKRLRINDQGIMQTAMKTYSDRAILVHINKCRLYLQVNTLAELSNDTGTHLLPTALYGTADEDGTPRLHQFSTSKLNWPFQPRPPSRSWTVWKSFLQTLTKPTTTTTLITRLGHWTSHVHTQRVWKFIRVHNQIIEHKHGDAVTYYRQTSTPHQYEIMTDSSPCFTATNTMFPITPESYNEHRMTTFRISTRYHEPATITASTSPSWAIPFYHQDVTNPTNSSNLHVYTTSLRRYSTSQFVCRTMTDTQQLFNIHRQIPPANTTTKLRAELYAILTAIITIQHRIQNNANITITIWVNQRSLCNKLTAVSRNSSTDTLSPEYELLRSVKHVLNDIPNVKFCDSSILSQIDSHHAERISSLHKHPFDPSLSTMIHPSLPGQTATLFINNQETTVNLASTLRCAATTPAYIDYLLDRNPTWTTAIINTIDWRIQHLALCKLTYGHKKTIKKFIHNWLPVNDHPSCIQHICTTTCPQCNAEDETQQHFLICNKPLWDEIISDITLTTKQLHIDPILADLLIQSVSNRHPLFVPSIPNMHYDYQTLVKQQTQLGWTEILKGRITQQWALQQDKYSHQTNGHQVLSRLLHVIYLKVLQAWKERCNIQHGHSNSAATARIIHQLTPKVQALYSTRPKLLQIDQLLFDVPIHEILQKPLKQLELWISRTTKIVKQGLHRAKDFEKHQTPSIKNYFQPATLRMSSTTIPCTVVTTHPFRSTIKQRPKSSQRTRLTIDTDSDTSACSSPIAPRTPLVPLSVSSPESCTTIRPSTPPDRFEAQNYKLP